MVSNDEDEASDGLDKHKDVPNQTSENVPNGGNLHVIATDHNMVSSTGFLPVPVPGPNGEALEADVHKADGLAKEKDDQDNDRADDKDV